jgi:hypothetical protein
MLSGVTDEFGEAEVNLPPEAGTLAFLPAITCYISGDGVGWFVLALDTDQAALASACIIGQGAAGGLSVLVLAGADLLFRVVVVY